jgi:hypothetical protein
MKTRGGELGPDEYVSKTFERFHLASTENENIEQTIERQQKFTSILFIPPNFIISTPPGYRVCLQPVHVLKEALEGRRRRVHAVVARVGLSVEAKVLGKETDVGE